MCGLFLIATFVGLSYGFGQNTHLCDEILTVNCATQYTRGEINEIVCGSDDTTYNNFCEYSQARCKTPSTHIVYIGPCVFTTTTIATSTKATQKTTPIVVATNPVTTQPTVPTTTMDQLMKVFCASKDSIDCTKDLDPICGSDKKFYLNKCEFSKQTCDNPSLMAVSQDVCI